MKTIGWVLALGVVATVALADIGPIRPPQPKKTQPDGPRVIGVRTPRWDYPARTRRQPISPRMPVIQPTSQPVRENPVVQMQSADVLAELKPANRDDLKIIAGQDGKAAAEKRWVAAEVVCDFRMHCTKLIGNNADYWMAFPLFAKGDPNCRVARFEVAIDGEVIEDVETLGDWRVEPPVIENARRRPKTSTKKKTPVKHRVYQGYQWPAKAQAGKTRRVQVVYRLLLPTTKDRAFFRYVLRSGSLWSGSIGRETVTVRADRQLKLDPPRSRTLKPVARKDGSWLWVLTKAEPTEDIVLTACFTAPRPPKPPAKPVGLPVASP